MASLFHFNLFTILASAVLIMSTACETPTSQSTNQLPASSVAKKSPGVTALDSNANAQERNPLQIKLLPMDEGERDKSFREFRNRLLAAVHRHDANQMLSVLHPGIENGYDIEAGVGEFKRRWKPEDPESSIWDVLSSILTGGGSFTDDHREFCGPYVVSNWSSVVQQLPKGTDSLDYVAITGKDVDVRLEPKLTAPVVARLTYDVVRSVHKSEAFEPRTGQAPSWVKIVTPTGQEGYVPDTYVQGPMDYGACFKRTNGKWVITKLAATE